MAFFWCYFRFQRFFGVLYPPTFSYELFGIPLNVSLVFIVELVVVGLACIAARRQIDRMMRLRRPLVFACAAVGSIGALAMLSLSQGGAPAALLWPASLLIAVGFAANCLAWATYFSADFGAREVCILVASYLASLAFIPALGLVIDVDRTLVLLTPLVSGAAWLLSPRSENPEFDQSGSALKSIGLYVPLFIVFLIAGSAMRGIVDVAGGGGSRTGLSIAIGALICALFWYYCGKPNPFAGTSKAPSAGAFGSVEKAVFKSWVVLVFLFLFGLFVSLVAPYRGFGGHVVVIARSFLDLFLWVLLCNLAFHKKISPVLLFVACSLFVEALSWCLSYVVIPILLYLTGEGLPLQNSIGLAVVFVLFSSVTLIFSSIVRRQADAKAPSGQGDVRRAEISEELAARYGLTNREVEIANLFMRGRSLKKVASMLVISPSTAQSHIKSVYRKLDVHSKDELIDLAERWNAV
ncbi:helix-turn-helix transcriptional regulator [Arabiibacter massiliensis]|uniref:helix-turn-helix transcriptional regulator n=1 Tax=Arabiibacter massiliensis TaxID=1870985 RepID=UPI00155B1AB8|nr:helix-turn-helix transcriptional regulator [Arabiibacter massiliensis]